MGVFHLFQIVQMVPNRAKHQYFSRIFKKISMSKHTLSLITPISQNGLTYSNNSSVICLRILWVCLTILWDWRLKDYNAPNYWLLSGPRRKYITIIYVFTFSKQNRRRFSPTPTKSYNLNSQVMILSQIPFPSNQLDFGPTISGLSQETHQQTIVLDVLSNMYQKLILRVISGGVSDGTSTKT